MKIDSKELQVTQNGYSVTALRQMKKTNLHFKFFILKYQNRISLIVGCLPAVGDRSVTVPP